MIVRTQLMGQCETCKTVVVQLIVSRKECGANQTVSCPVCEGYADEHLIWMNVEKVEKKDSPSVVS